MARPKRKLWGKTRYGAHEIPIYVRKMSPDLDGLTHQNGRNVCIELNEELLHSPSLLDETLTHEFIHVLEYLNSPEAFDIEVHNNCCAMVQTISKGLIQLMRELHQVGCEP